MNKREVQYSINKIAKFLAARDVNKLDSKELQESFAINKVNVLVLLGNSIPYTVECAATAYKNNLCDIILINGGIGHSTELLRNNIRTNEMFKSIEVDGKAEADIFFDIMTKIYNIPHDKIIVENKSTNCGDNASKAIELLDKLNISYSSLLLIQDPTMQLRTYASFLKYIGDKKVKLINYAPFIPSVDNNLKLINQNIYGIWEEKRYFKLIMGEIPRLMDDSFGYGPCGRNFIAHVNIPSEIEENYVIIKQSINDNDLYTRCEF